MQGVQRRLSAALLLNTEGVATMAIAWVVFRENVARKLMLGAFAILAGAVLLSWDGHGVSVDASALLVVGARVAWGIDNNVTRKISSDRSRGDRHAQGADRRVAPTSRWPSLTGATFLRRSCDCNGGRRGRPSSASASASSRLFWRCVIWGRACTGAYYALAPFHRSGPRHCACSANR